MISQGFSPQPLKPIVNWQLDRLNWCILKQNLFEVQDPDGEIENSGKSIFEIRISNFRYIQVIVFDQFYPFNDKDWVAYQDPVDEIENSGKSIFEIRIPNFCYIQVIVFDLSYLPQQQLLGLSQYATMKKCEKYKKSFS